MTRPVHCHIAFVYLLSILAHGNRKQRLISFSHEKLEYSFQNIVHGPNTNKWRGVQPRRGKFIVASRQEIRWMVKLQSHPFVAVIFLSLRRFAIRVQVLPDEEWHKVFLDLQTRGPSQSGVRRNNAGSEPTSTLDHHKSLTWSRPHGARTSGRRLLSPNVTQHTPGLRQSNFSVPSRTRLTPCHMPWQMDPATARAEMPPGARTSGATGERNRNFGPRPSACEHGNIVSEKKN
jgi:hypothetical protein